MNICNSCARRVLVTSLYPVFRWSIRARGRAGPCERRIAKRAMEGWRSGEADMAASLEARLRLIHSTSASQYVSTPDLGSHHPTLYEGVSMNNEDLEDSLRATKEQSCS